MTAGDRHRSACHEAGHAVAAWLLGRVVLMVSLDGPTGGPCSVDRKPFEPLNGHRRALPYWHAVEDEMLIVLAGAMCEGLADESEQPTADYAALPREPRRAQSRRRCAPCRRGR